MYPWQMRSKDASKERNSREKAKGKDKDYTMYYNTTILLLLLVVVVVVVVVVVPNSLLGGLWTKCMFVKKVFSPRPDTTFQVNFNATTHLLNLKCKKHKKVFSPRRDAPFRVYVYIITKNDFEIWNESNVICNEFEHYFEHLTQAIL